MASLSATADPQVVIVANRGPNDFVLRDGSWVTRPATGGLVSMLAPLARRPNVTWFCCVSEPPGAAQARRALFTTAADQVDPRLDVVPVPLPAATYQAYYGQISNEVLWMLQHNLTGAAAHDALDHRRHRAWQEGYLAANARIAATIAARTPSVRAFLIQDYHLYPLPALLRRGFPSTPILHFTHIPFPAPSILRLLPAAWRETILGGLLGADVVGLQTETDVEAFLACYKDKQAASVDRRQATVVAQDGRSVRVRAFPASPDAEELSRTMRSTAVDSARRRLAPAFEQLTIVRVDRLDPSKNQLVGFRAFGRLLETRPDLRGRVRFLAFLVPSRTDLSVYRAYREAAYRAIDAINSRFMADCGGAPIQVFYTNDRHQALAAMERCDVLLVNSVADGMNLVAKEWALITTRPGTLVASETTGVAREAAGSALMVSPLDIEGTADAMASALDMPCEERARRHARFHERVSRWTATEWLDAQLEELGLEPHGRVSRTTALASGRVHPS